MVIGGVAAAAALCVGVGAALVNSGPRANDTANDATVSVPAAAGPAAAPSAKSSLPDREICRFDSAGGSYYLHVVSATAHQFDACQGASVMYPGTIDSLLQLPGMDRRCILPNSYTTQHNAMVTTYSDRKATDLAAAREFCRANGGTDNG